MELFDPNIKKFLIFSQKKAVLIFNQTKTPENNPYISGNRTFYILGNGNLKKIRYISGKGTLLYFMLEK